YKIFLFKSNQIPVLKKKFLGVPSPDGAGNTKIGFIMGIVGLAKNCDLNIHDFAYNRKVVKIFLIRKLSYLI
ncbi:MAG: hypothetical protein ACK5C4_11980, partial [Pseudanabaena sp.]